MPLGSQRAFCRVLPCSRRHAERGLPGSKDHVVSQLKPVRQPVKEYRNPILGLRLSILGGILVAVGIVTLVVLLVLVTQGDRALLRTLEKSYTEYRVFGLVQRRRSVASLIFSIPAVLALLAVCAVIPGEQLRRGVWLIRDRPLRNGSPPRGRTVAARFRPLNHRTHALWALPALVAWAALILVPIASANAGSWPADLSYGVESYIWLILGVYGATAFGAAAVILTSLTKKIVNARHTGADRAGVSDRSRRFWSPLTYHARCDLWLAAIGGTFLGATPLPLHFDDTGLLSFTVPIGTATLVLGILTSWQFWKAGEDLGTVTGGVRSNDDMTTTPGTHGRK
jgi:hypothetical protein